MGKSLNNYIGLTEPPEQIYGKTMAIPDSLIEKYLRLVSGLSNNEVTNTLASSPRIAKGALARQLVKRLHGEEAATRAEEAFVNQFVKKDYKANLEQYEFTGGPADPVSILVATGIAKSRGDAARLIEQGGLRVNGDKSGNERMLAVGDIISARRRNIQLK
jgi:tyrosyl-tRNA synthetase